VAFPAVTVFSVVLIVPFAYQLLAIAACVRHRRHKRKHSGFEPPISILKPVHGLDPNMLRALVSQAEQNYPEFEILFGVNDAVDPAIPVIHQLREAFPMRRIELFVGTKPAQNAKVGILGNLAEHARYDVWLVSDSDIRVTPEYLRQVAGPLEDSGVGVVTCLYRPVPYSAASSWEAFGIAIDFMPSTLVAPLVGVREFGLGSTLCFRAEDLETAGGFAALADYIADDYQLARRIVQLGKPAYLSEYVVETSLGDASWRGAFEHQLRWARTIKASKGAGFAGLPVTHTGVWIVVALLLHLWAAAALLAVVRVAAALASGWLVIRFRRQPAWALLAPIWDLYAFAVWLFSYTSNEVRWREKQLRIGPEGKIESM
jgi:ceramide glucosyltransferase